MSYRKEKKYKLTYSDLCELKSELSNSGMEILYNPRIINSCYFDNNYHDMFHDSEEGVLPRKKIRIRWYDGNAKLSYETKISSIEGRFKKKVSLNSANKPQFFQDSIYGIVTPSLKVTYNRNYYILDKMRITFDFDIKYYNLRFNSPNVYEDDEFVMEIKTSEYVSDDYIESIIPIPTSRFSKYSRGLIRSRYVNL